MTNENYIRLISKYNRELSELMNKIHSVQYSERFWRLILSTYLGAMVNHYEKLSSIEKTNLVTFLPYNFLLNKTLTKQKYIKLVKHFYLANQKSQNVNYFKSAFKEGDKFVAGARWEVILKNNPGYTRLPNYEALTLKRFIFNRENSKRILVKEQSKEIDDIFLKNILLNLPEYYIEYFNFIDKHCTMLLSLNSNEKEFHVEQGLSRFLKHLIGRSLEKDSKLYYYQPGGWMGEMSFNKGHFNQTHVADKFYTYGWKIYENDEPGRSYRLLAFEQKYKQNRTTEVKYDMLVCYSILNKKSKERYKQLTEKLLIKIKNRQFEKFLLRPRGSSRKKDNFNDLRFLQLDNFKASYVKVDPSNRYMAEVMPECKLVIHFDHPSTNFLECVFVDHPVMCIQTNKTPSEIVKPFYSYFLKVGVMHNDFHSMLDFLNKLESVEKWWNEVKISEEYKKFKDTFASR